MKKWRATRLQDLPFTPGYLLLIRERIEENYTVTPGGCWEWDLTRTEFGYGKITLKQKKFNKSLIAHRLYYQLVVDYIPDNLVLGHKCDNPPCINPDHMEVTTQRENNAKGIGVTADNLRKTACDNGHKFTQENTGRYKNGWRYCRTCSRLRSKASHRKRTLRNNAKGLNAGGKPFKSDIDLRRSRAWDKHRASV